MAKKKKKKKEPTHEQGIKSNLKKDQEHKRKRVRFNAEDGEGRTCEEQTREPNVQIKESGAKGPGTTWPVNVMDKKNTVSKKSAALLS